MGFWSNRQDSLVIGRMVEEQLYSQALNEVESGVRRGGLWAKALAASGGDEARAKAQYINLVVQALKDETHMQRRSLKAAVSRQRSLEHSDHTHEPEPEEAAVSRIEKKQAPPKEKGFWPTFIAVALIMFFLIISFSTTS